VDVFSNSDLDLLSAWSLVFWNITDERKAGVKVQHLPGLTLAWVYPDI
jgi:hypothetical protein